MPMSTLTPLAPPPPSTAVAEAVPFSTTVPSASPPATHATASRSPSTAVIAASLTAGPTDSFCGAVQTPFTSRERNTCGTPPSRLR